MNSDTSGYQYILAYGMAIAIFILVIRTKIGYSIIYYALVLSVLFVALSQSQFISTSLAPLTADVLKPKTA